MADWLQTLKNAIATVDTVADAIQVITDALPDSGALTTLLANIAAILADTGTDGVVVATQTTAFERRKGAEQVFMKTITSAANAGDVTVATATVTNLLIESITLFAWGAAPADVTSAGIFGGNIKETTFIPAADALEADLDAVDKQVSWNGAVLLRQTRTIVISLVGIGATAVDFRVVVKYRSLADGGYLA